MTELKQMNLNLALGQQKDKAPASAPASKLQPRVFGTGLTKKVINKHKRITLNHLAAPTDKLDSLVEQTATANTFDGIEQPQLPNTLVDPNMQPDASQSNAIAGLIKQQYGAIIGSAGTGKTATMKWLVHAILEQNPETKIAFVAFTGRAVQQMRKALPAEFQDKCDTIHGHLEYKPVAVETIDEKGRPYVRRIFEPHRNVYEPLHDDVIIVDEAGMCMTLLANKLFAALKSHTRVYLLGDINQLPPPMGHSVLGFAMLDWPTFELQTLHRTKENAIIDGAHRILQGKIPKRADAKVALVEIDNDPRKAFLQTCQVIQKLHQNDKFNPMSDTLIVPQNVSALGQIEFNNQLMNYFNPVNKINNVPINPRTVINAGTQHHTFAIGDKVMVTKNDREEGLTNGMIGIIESININSQYKGRAVGDMAGKLLKATSFDMEALNNVGRTKQTNDVPDDEEAKVRQASHVVGVRFQGRDEANVFSTAGAVSTLQLAYASTCHKAQGGEFPTVVIVVHSSNPRLLSREWLYTAYTRAQKNVIILYNSRGMGKALSTQLIYGKTLEEKAKAFIAINARNEKELEQLTAGDENENDSILQLPPARQLGT